MFRISYSDNINPSNMFININELATKFNEIMSNTEQIYYLLFLLLISNNLFCNCYTSFIKNKKPRKQIINHIY